MADMKSDMEKRLDTKLIIIFASLMFVTLAGHGNQNNNLKETEERIMEAIDG